MRLLILALILAMPLRADTWVVLAKPGYEVIGTFELAKGGALNINIDTRELCIKTFEIIGVIPADLVGVIETKTSQIIIDKKSVPMVVVSIDKAKIEAGFSEQKYIFNLKDRKFKLKPLGK